jgi:hypothetical protein
MSLLRTRSGGQQAVDVLIQRPFIHVWIQPLLHEPQSLIEEECFPAHMRLRESFHQDSDAVATIH